MMGAVRPHMGSLTGKNLFQSRSLRTVYVDRKTYNTQSRQCNIIMMIINVIAALFE